MASTFELRKCLESKMAERLCKLLLKCLDGYVTTWNPIINVCVCGHNLVINM